MRDWYLIIWTVGWKIKSLRLGELGFGKCRGAGGRGRDAGTPAFAEFDESCHGVIYVKSYAAVLFAMKVCTGACSEASLLGSAFGGASMCCRVPYGRLSLEGAPRLGRFWPSIGLENVGDIICRY